MKTKPLSDFREEEEEKSEALRLKICDVKACEAMCCHDGVYLLEGEEAFLVKLVECIPELKTKLPGTFVEDGYWNEEYYGRKTSTRPHEYLNADYPAHFPRTRCVFGDEDGYCELEKLGRANGLHPWTFKPATCWIFPLSLREGRLLPPPRHPADDPHRLKDYPGYVTFVRCGRHEPGGDEWQVALSRERAYLEEVVSLPVLGSPGHGVNELLGLLGRTGFA